MEPDVFPRPCTIAAALSVLGEKWSLLVVRELALGVHRFDAIARNTGAPRDILTSRLRRLEAEGVLEKRRYQEHPPRFEYHLTPAGDELRPILLSLSQWGERWTDERPTATWVHSCGADLELAHTCSACGGEVTGVDLRRRRRDAA
ncbi:MAG TPA: helix-turn-helix domain-containing protein [Gaiellaceae bacterium]|nr:helix-turn-helix domain-containing protein [Gaiellaceae bacterium]